MRDVIVEHKGRIAVDCGWQADWNKPEEYRILYVGRASAATWPDIIGAPITWTGNTGAVCSNGRYYYIQSDDAREWTKQVETRPVKKPRRGKDYDWRWESGSWRKDWR